MRPKSSGGAVVVIAANTAWSIANFRRELILQLTKAGYDTVAVAPPDEYVERIPCRFVPIQLNRWGTNPFQDLRLLRQLKRLYRGLRPAAALHFTAKLNIYGTLASGRLGIRSIANISGLGSGFLGGGPVSLIQRILYWAALRQAEVVFFQNEDDARYFTAQRLVRPEQLALLPGSGVDTRFFAPRPRPRSAAFAFLLIARLIRDKGIYEYAEAARLLRTKYPAVEFRLMGFPDDSNPKVIPAARLRRWSSEGTVVLVGHSDDVREAIGRSDCVVLPSYREGTPRTLLEAASMARPLITTDVPGCRQVVDEGTTGYLCRARDAADLAGKMERMLNLSREERELMGRRGREKMQRDFEQDIVIRKYLEVLAGPPAGRT